MPISFNFLPVNTSLNCKGRLISLEGGRIMGILNTTPDSFYDGGRYEIKAHAVAQAEKMLHEGADFIDIGGYSTRPGADFVSEAEEMDRTIPAVEAILESFPETLISIDTFRASVAKEAIKAGAAIINDVTAGEGDAEMSDTAAALQVPYIIMHKQGGFKDMQNDPVYEDVVKEVIQYLNFKIEALKAKGVHDIIIDPGFGFGKTVAHNYQLLKNLHELKMMGKPVLAGVSRKSMINKVLHTLPQNALAGTIAVNMLALAGGADILRVHDVKEAAQALKIFNYYRETV